MASGAVASAPLVDAEPRQTGCHAITESELLDIAYPVNSIGEVSSRIGVRESASAALPCCRIPSFVDQFRNAFSFHIAVACTLAEDQSHSLVEITKIDKSSSKLIQSNGLVVTNPAGASDSELVVI